MLVFVQVIFYCSLYIVVYSYRFGYGVFLIQQDNRVLVGKYNDELIWFTSTDCLCILLMCSLLKTDHIWY